MGMEYRKLPHGEESLSVIGMGTSSIGMADEKEIAATVELALESGVNFFDMASADAAPFPVYGQVMAGVRDQVHFQVHFGANYQGGTYGWTTDLDTIKRSVDWQLKALKPITSTSASSTAWTRRRTCARSWTAACWTISSPSGAPGGVRHIALSSHTPRVRQVLDLGARSDLMMVQHQPRL